MASHVYNYKNHPKIRMHQKDIMHNAYKMAGFPVNVYDIPYK